MTPPHVWGGLLLSVLLLTGCGEDRPQMQSNAPPPSGSAAVAPSLAPTSSGSPPDALVGGGGAGQTYSDPPPDVLMGEGGQASPASPPDALIGGEHAGKTYSDPLLSQDPLGGPKMPTDHSHWLRGRIRNARVTVRLNGIRQGAYSSMVDQDVTMRLRKGINSVTFTYVPDAPNALAQMEVVESEHTPPIPPLVTFLSPPAPRAAALRQLRRHSRSSPR